MDGLCLGFPFEMFSYATHVFSFCPVRNYVPDTYLGYSEELAGGDGDGDGDTECAYHDGLSIFDRHLQAFGEVFSIYSMHLYIHLRPQFFTHKPAIATP